VRGAAGGNQQETVESERVERIGRHDQVPMVDGIEGPPEDADAHAPGSRYPRSAWASGLSG
jgi:hypothetical protein